MTKYQGKGIIYYSDNRLDEPIFSIVQKLILQSKLPIVSVTHKRIELGENYVLNGPSTIVTMIKQIVMALDKSKVKYVFFCEHDVLYPPSHFEFTPPKDNIFYYNSNVWRWDYPQDRAIAYERLISLSGLCVNRQFALNHYRRRLKKILEEGFDKDTKRHEPDWARKWGYEPGTKKVRRGGFSDDDFETWESKDPLIDIRHNKNFSPRKVTLDSFKHPPTGWKEISIKNLPYWNLEEMFNLKKVIGN
ncbi:MAG: hypothetical protein NZM26_02200 [Patescibacteria group bacterium]|nr:hypothetical protein [Patescibacteria group bacterium]